MRPQTIPAFYDDDLNLVVTFETDGSIAGDTYEFNCVDKLGALKFRLTSGGGEITISDAGSVSTPGVVAVAMVGRLDLAIATYSWALVRTNSGRVKTVAEGPLPLRPSWRNAS